MTEPPENAPKPAPAVPHDLPFIREFDDRGSLWLFEDPENLRGLLQILDADLAARLDFTRATRATRSFIRPDLREKEQVGQWVRVVWFLVLLVFHRREERALIQTIITEARESRFNQTEKVAIMGLSVAQQLQAKGEARGEARGRTEATRGSLEIFLIARFGPLPETVRQAIAAADLETLNDWLPRAATAATLAEVGIPGDGETA
jgi:hypothetical protein